MFKKEIEKGSETSVSSPVRYWKCFPCILFLDIRYRWDSKSNIVLFKNMTIGFTGSPINLARGEPQRWVDKMTEVKSHPLRIDPNAKSTSKDEPAFIAKPEGASVYYGFPIVPESETEGWYYGTITEFEEPDGCTDGDGFVVAPDGSQAGLVWQVGYEGFEEISPPTPDRWGVYAVGFIRPVRAVEDLVYNFREILPKLKKKYEDIKGRP